MINALTELYNFYLDDSKDTIKIFTSHLKKNRFIIHTLCNNLLLYSKKYISHVEKDVVVCARCDVRFVPYINCCSDLECCGACPRCGPDVNYKERYDAVADYVEVIKIRKL